MADPTHDILNPPQADWHTSTLRLLTDYPSTPLRPSPTAYSLTASMEFHTDPLASWATFLSALVSAVLAAPAVSDTPRLAALLAAFTRLPAAVNTRAEAIEHTSPDGVRHSFPPGAALTLAGAALWAGLPGFSLCPTEQQCGGRDVFAGQAWVNWGTFVAHFAAEVAGVASAPQPLQDSYLQLLRYHLEGLPDRVMSLRPGAYQWALPAAVVMEQMGRRVYAVHGGEDVRARFPDLSEWWDGSTWECCKSMFRAAKTCWTEEEAVREAAERGERVMEEIDGAASEDTE